MSEQNPRDGIIRDPVDPERHAEDPMYGPPAMPLGDDGTYYQPGVYYGTRYVDSQGRPVLRSIGSTMAIMREVLDLQEWLEAYRKGGNAIIALEAKRQLERLKKTGFAHCYKLSDVCPGGKRLEDCETGNTAYQAGQEWAADNGQERPSDGTLSNVLAWAGSKCVGCTVSCGVAVRTVDGEPRETRVSFYIPDPNILTIGVDVSADRTV